MKKLILVTMLVSTTAFAKNYRISISGMSCGSCAQKITKEFKKDANVEKVDVDHEKGLMTLTTKKDAKDGDIKKTINDMGYEVTKIEIYK